MYESKDHGYLKKMVKMGVIILNKQEYVLTDRALRFQPLNCLNENNKSQKLMTA